MYARPMPCSCASFKTQVPGRDKARVVRTHHIHNGAVFSAYRAIKLYEAKPMAAAAATDA